MQKHIFASRGVFSKTNEVVKYTEMEGKNLVNTLTQLMCGKIGTKDLSQKFERGKLYTTHCSIVPYLDMRQGF